jgi:hypothetical protein
MIVARRGGVREAPAVFGVYRSCGGHRDRCPGMRACSECQALRAPCPVLVGSAGWRVVGRAGGDQRHGVGRDAVVWAVLGEGIAERADAVMSPASRPGGRPLAIPAVGRGDSGLSWAGCGLAGMRRRQASMPERGRLSIAKMAHSRRAGPSVGANTALAMTASRASAITVTAARKGTGAAASTLIACSAWWRRTFAGRQRGAWPRRASRRCSRAGSPVAGSTCRSSIPPGSARGYRWAGRPPRG